MKRILLLAICVLLVSCSAPQKGTEVPLYVGSEGLALSFPERNNFQFYEADVFSIAMRVENKGASDVDHPHPGWVSALYDPAVLKLIGIRTHLGNYNSTEDLRTHVPFVLKGRSDDVPIGEIDFIDFTFQALSVAGNRDDATTSVSFNVCYPYNTTFIENICIDRDVFNTEASKGCIGHAVTGSSQGAPVAVTQVEQTYLRQGNVVQPRFRIHIRNLKDGYVLYNTTFVSAEQVCAQDDFRREEFGRVKVNAFLNNVPLACGTEPGYTGIARFDGDETQIICRLIESVQAGANYETPLIVQLQYFYISSLTANVEVENIEP